MSPRSSKYLRYVLNCVLTVAAAYICFYLGQFALNIFSVLWSVYAGLGIEGKAFLHFVIAILAALAAYFTKLSLSEKT